MDYTQISIIKRDGKTEPFSLDKIVRAITKAFRAGGITDEGQAVEQIASDVAAAITKAEISVEEIQDMVEERLMKRNPSIAKRYIIYREWRNVERDRRSSIKSVMDGIVTVEKNDINLSNANMSSHTPAGQMMTFASEITKDYALKYLVGVRHGRAHRDGDIHIHDLDYYPTKTTTCIQYDLGDIYERGFSTKNGSVRTPQSIQSYATLATIVFQTNQNEQHGGQSIPAFDHFMAPGVLKTFRRHLTDMTLHDGYIEYTLLYDMIANRITIDEVKAENGGLRLMKNLTWEYDALPHALICGGTGGGKTYFLLTIIEALLQTDAQLYILDPKNADLADLGTVMDNVYHTKEDMIECVNAFYEGMVQRSEEMKQHPDYKTGENYAYLGLPPCFLIFDEYVAFLEMLGTKESISLLSQLKKIVMLGRQAGYFLIVACQRPDAKYFSDGIRDNFNFRVGLGRISELGYGMLFGSDVKKQFFQKRIKGRGYCDVGTSVISEFYTPLVPKGHDFLQTIGSLALARQAVSDERKEN